MTGVLVHVGSSKRGSPITMGDILLDEPVTYAMSRICGISVPPSSSLNCSAVRTPLFNGRVTVTPARSAGSPL